ncbi:MAG: DNA mismatch endonuclease Vsr [Rhodocyclaceae bacterium]|nr:DNA mismatch endonuclease Vsr [Rhodocyclaceae bacterium]
MDVVDAATRSRMMAGIRGKDTAPELAVRKGLHAAGFRFRLHRRDLPGRPDIVLPRYRAVVFVHGCFWHRHAGCRYATTPSSNAMRWTRKFSENVARDRAAIAALESAGWRVAVTWECGLRAANQTVTIAALAAWLPGSTTRHGV